MKYKDVGSMIVAHIQDMVDSGFNDGDCVKTAVSTMITLLFAMHNNDTEDIIADVDRICDRVKEGIDGGEFDVYNVSTIN